MAKTNNDLGFAYQKLFMLYFLLVNFKSDFSFFYEGNNVDSLEGDFIIGESHYEAKTGVTNNEDAQELHFSITEKEAIAPSQFKTALKQLKENKEVTKKIFVTNKKIVFNNNFKQGVLEKLFGQMHNVAEYSLQLTVGKTNFTFDKNFIDEVLIFSVPITDASNEKELVLSLAKHFNSIDKDDEIFSDYSIELFKDIKKSFKDILDNHWRNEKLEMIDFRLLYFLNVYSLQTSKQEAMLGNREKIMFAYDSRFMGTSVDDPEINDMVSTLNRYSDKFEKIVRLRSDDE